MNKIEQLATTFREAINKAFNAGEFDNEIPFGNFPCGCCGDACDLLAHFLLKKGIRSAYVCGTCRDDNPENKQSHAWLLVDNDVIIDITGDQFKRNPIFMNFDYPVFVGTEDDFHRLFERDCIYENNGLEDLEDASKSRLFGLYNKISMYL
jgi:hypothetical protein